jgi:hypothetical protein
MSKSNISSLMASTRCISKKSGKKFSKKIFSSPGDGIPFILHQSLNAMATFFPGGIFNVSSLQSPSMVVRDRASPKHIPEFHWIS